ncbi:MAG TPA: helix-turn-helix domain-containing protein [Solirubrobacteraceae bacterium]|jgi:AcrR family transcriptional regulator|nr:helix-turn-helix domain-containing protein [Solirubrobacteraceae bacterium]
MAVSSPRAPARVGVGEIQRARIVAAMGELVRERGAAGVAVAHVVTRSGVSRRTFYELFEDREDCFLVAFDTAVARAGESVLTAYRARERWRERVRDALEATLAFLDAEPELGYLCVVGALGGGTRALERRTLVVGRLVDAVHEGRLESRAQRRPERLVAEGVVGAVLAVVHARMVECGPVRTRSRGDASKPLLALLNPLMGMIVLPYLGARAAELEQRRPAPTPRAPVRSQGDPLRELDMRLTYRTVRVLLAIASAPASSNRQVATAAGISDQGQISKLLARLHALGLIENTGGDHAKGEANAWTLTQRGDDVARTIQIQKN